MTLAEALQTHLRLREDAGDAEWQVWEHKTFNIHRGVLCWRPSRSHLSFAEMTALVRESVKAHYPVSWWRGFGFGVLIEARALPPDLADIDDAIATRAAEKGTWQWTVFACEPARTCIGVHTWTEGYLSPVYRQLIARYESLGWSVGSFKKEKDHLMQFLTAAARIKGHGLHEFEP